MVNGINNKYECYNVIITTSCLVHYTVLGTACRSSNYAATDVVIAYYGLISRQHHKKCILESQAFIA